jgi:hypothetical protein
MKYILVCKKYDKWTLDWDTTAIVLTGNKLILGKFDTLEEALWEKDCYQEKFIEAASKMSYRLKPNIIRNLEQLIGHMIVYSTLKIEEVSETYPELLLYDFEVKLMD